MELFVLRADSILQFDLKSLRNVEFSDLLVDGGGEGIVDVVGVEDLLDLLLCGGAVLSCGVLDHWCGSLIIAFTEDIDSHLLLLKLLWAGVVLLTVLVKLLATQVILEGFALLLVLSGVDLHLVVLLVLLGLDFDLLLDDVLVLSGSLLLCLNIGISLQSVLLLETDTGIFLEHLDVLVVELDRLFLLARCASFLLLPVPFFGLLLEEFLFDLVVTNDEFFEL